MSDAFQQPPIVDAQETNPDARTMGMLAHLLAIFTGFIGPLIIWLIKKDQYPFVNDQGKESLNFQITVVLSMMVGMVLTFASCGFLFPLPLAVVIANIVFCIIATLKANSGVWYRYPVCLRLIK
jgi:uncharacterized Tic20 family protein